MPKKPGQPSRIEAIYKLPDTRGGRLSWHERMKRDKPELYAEVVSIIDLHLNNDKDVRRKLPTETKLAAWLAEVITRQHQRVVTNTVGNLIRLRKDAQAG